MMFVKSESVNISIGLRILVSMSGKFRKSKKSEKNLNQRPALKEKEKKLLIVK